MILRSLSCAIASFAVIACAGAQDEAATKAKAPTIADVTANPDDWRVVDPDNLVIMDTSKGEIVLELLPELAPRHVERFQAYVKDGLYDQTVFHRVIKGFMAQGGDVRATHGAEKLKGPMEAEFVLDRVPADLPIQPIGPDDSAVGGLYKGFPVETVAQFMAEMTLSQTVESWIPHCAGVLSSARTTDENSADAQFFIITGDGRHLDRQYTAKGRVLVGLDVARAIKLGPEPDGFPIANPDVVRTARLASSLPEAERPVAYVQKTDNPDWTAKLDMADRLGNDVCTLPPVPAVIAR